MSEELKSLKEKQNGHLKEMGMDLLIDFERPAVPLWKYIISHCKSNLFVLFPFIIISYLAAHRLLLEYSHYHFFSFILSITFVFHMTYKMFSLAAIISEIQSLKYSFKVAVNQAEKSRNDVIEEINNALGYDLITFEKPNSLQPEQTATVLPFKKPENT
jgi:hypothetical protein